MTSIMQDGRVDPETLLDATGNVPADVMLNSFRMLTPLADVTGYVNLWQHLWNDEFVAAHQVMTQWGRDHIPFPGAAFLQMADLMNRQNLLLTGTIPLGGRDIHLADITVPFLNIIGEKDHIVPPGRRRPAVLARRVHRRGRAAPAVRARRGDRRQGGPAPQHPGDGRLDRPPLGAGLMVGPRTEVEVRALERDDVDALRQFFARVPEGDRTFFREDVLQPGVVERWLADPDQHRLDRLRRRRHRRPRRRHPGRRLEPSRRRDPPRRRPRAPPPRARPPARPARRRRGRRDGHDEARRRGRRRPGADGGDVLQARLRARGPPQGPRPQPGRRGPRPARAGPLRRAAVGRHAHDRRRGPRARRRGRRPDGAAAGGRRDDRAGPRRAATGAPRPPAAGDDGDGRVGADDGRRHRRRVGALPARPGRHRRRGPADVRRPVVRHRRHRPRPAAARRRSRARRSASSPATAGSSCRASSPPPSSAPTSST